MHSTQSAANPVPPVVGAVLVVQRWNSWVRVLEPESGLTRWVNLNEAQFEPASFHSAAGLPPARPRES